METDVVVERTELDVDELRRQLAQFEQDYGVPSERMVEAFTVDGQLVENDEFHRWSRLHSAFVTVQEHFVSGSA